MIEESSGATWHFSLALSSYARKFEGRASSRIRCLREQAVTTITTTTTTKSNSIAQNRGDLAPSLNQRQNVRVLAPHLSSYSTALIPNIGLLSLTS